MVYPIANSGIRADGCLDRSVATFKSDNYTSWYSRLKAALKISDCWRLTTGVEDCAAALLIMSIFDEEYGTVQSVDEDLVEIWKRLKEKFDRTSDGKQGSQPATWLTECQ